MEQLPFLADHRVFGEVVSPGACQLVTALEAARLAYPQQTLNLVDVVLPQPLVLAADSARIVQVIFSPVSGKNQATVPFELISFQAERAEESLQTHASGDWQTE